MKASFRLVRPAHSMAVPRRSGHYGDMTRQGPSKDIDESDLEVTHPKDYAAGVSGRSGVAATRESSRWEPCGPPERSPDSTSDTASTARGVRGRRLPDIASPPNSARTERRLLPRKQTLRTVTPEFFAEHSIADLEGKTGLLARTAGATDAPDGPDAGSNPLPADRLGRRVRTDRRTSERPRIAGRSGVLHLRSHVQRSRVSLPVDDSQLRHQQHARLFQHVSRVVRKRTDRIHRHRQRAR